MGMVREELRLRRARFLVAGLISELDYDGLREQVLAVLPFSTSSEADAAAKDLLARTLQNHRNWEKVDLPSAEPGVTPYRYGHRTWDGEWNSREIRIWVLPCSSRSSPLLQLLEAWLPFEAELVDWLD